MRISTDETMVELLGSVKSMLARHIAPILASEPEEQPLSAGSLRGIFEHIGTTGLFGARAPEPTYSTGLPLSLAGVVIENLPAFLAVASVAQEATIFRLGSGGSDELRRKYLPDLIRGRLIAGTAISEPEVGSASNSVTTTMTVDGDQCRVRGSKLWITNASVADIIVVAAMDSATQRVGRVLVDTSSTPVSARNLPMSGLERGHLCEIEIDVVVPRSNVLSDSNSTVMTKSWTLNRASMGLIACALAREALDAAVSFAKTRWQFGKPIGSHQLIQALLADSATSLEAARMLCYGALSMIDEGLDAVTSSSMAKLFATETAVSAVLKCQQVAGAAGLSEEYPFARLLRDARMLTIPDGTSQIQQLIIGRQLTGMSAFN